MAKKSKTNKKNKRSVSKSKYKSHKHAKRKPRKLTKKEMRAYRKGRVPPHHIPLKLAGVLLIMLGIISFLSGILFIYFAFSVVGVILAFGEVLMNVQLAVFLVGATAFTFGIVEIITGYGLLNLQKWAGYLAMVISVVTLIISVPYAVFNVFSGLVNFLLSVVIIILVYSKWKELAGFVF